MVSIAGGEPLMHPQIDEIVRELLDRGRSSCSCARTRCLLPKHIAQVQAVAATSRWIVHIDGLQERHDESVCKEGVFDQAVAAIKLAQAKGFRVNTNTTFFNTDTPQTIIDVLTSSTTSSRSTTMQISPGYAYEKAPDQEHFLGVSETRELFSKAFADGRRKKWRLNHSPLFLDFLEGKQDFECTAWGIPSYSLLGWQKPCYLMADGYVEDLQGADRDHRLGEVRPRQGPALRQLHGALRLRAVGRAGHDGLAQGDDPGRARHLTLSLTSSLRCR